MARGKICRAKDQGGCVDLLFGLSVDAKLEDCIDKLTTICDDMQYLVPSMTIYTDKIKDLTFEHDEIVSAHNALRNLLIVAKRCMWRYPEDSVKGKAMREDLKEIDEAREVLEVEAKEFLKQEGAISRRIVDALERGDDTLAMKGFEEMLGEGGLTLKERLALRKAIGREEKVEDEDEYEWEN